MTTDETNKVRFSGNKASTRPVHPLRQGWEEHFKIMAEQGDDMLLDSEVAVLTIWDYDEWEW